jgi:hypothetical protein
MSTVTSLADLIFGRTRGAILALLYGRADQTFYTRQIAREVAASVGAVQRELVNLTKVGLVIRTALGSQVFYQAIEMLQYSPRCTLWYTKPSVFSAWECAHKPKSGHLNTFQAELFA